MLFCTFSMKNVQYVKNVITMKHILAYIEAKPSRYWAKLDDLFPFYRNFIEIFTVLTKYLFDLGVRLTEFSVTVESVTLRFYCTSKWFLCYYFPYFFQRPLTFLYWWAVSVGGEELKWHWLAHHQLMSQPTIAVRFEINCKCVYGAKCIVWK